MVETRDKVIGYRRAVWLKMPPDGQSLEFFVREVHEKLSKVNNRIVQRYSQKIKSAKPRLLNDGGILLHLTADTSGEAASVVKAHHDEAEDVETGTAPAPSQTEYMDADAFALIVRDDVFICTSGFREKALTFIIAELMEKAGISEFSNQFDLMPSANVDKVKLIENEGVAAIDMRATMYAASESYIEHKKSYSNAMTGFSNIVTALAGDQDDEVSVDGSAEDDVEISVILKGSGRFRKGISVGHRSIEEIAQNLIENAEQDDEFQIITRSGRRISQSEVYIRTKVTMEKSGKSVAKESAWKELIKVYKDLKHNGALDG